MKTISIMPANGGWLVTCDAIDNPMMFRRGRSAERTAMRIAEAAASNGELVRIEVRLADGTVAKRFIAPAVHRKAEASDIVWARPPLSGGAESAAYAG